MVRLPKSVVRLILITAAILMPVGAFGATVEDLLMATNNTPFYDPYDTCPGSTQSIQAQSIYILGDSITLKTKADYQQALTTAGYTTVNVDASTGRTITKAGTDGDKTSGMDAITKDASEIAKAGVIVIALGTNGDNTKANIDNAIIAIRKLNANAAIFWIDAFILNNASYNDSVIALGNLALYSEAQSQNYGVISWVKLVDPAADPQNLLGNEADPNNYIDTSDGLGYNPTVAGSAALAQAVSQQISQGTPTSAHVITNTFTYTDGARSGRKVSVTVYMPNDSQRYPLIMFAPGRNQNSTTTGLYGGYLNDIAAEGFVVAGADFPDNTSYAAVPSEATDMSFLAKQVTNEAKLATHIDTTNGIGLLGHSDGAMVALLDGYSKAYKDPTFTAIMAEDGTLYGGQSWGPGAPLFMMHGLDDTTQPISSGSIAVFNTLTTTKYMALAEVVGADHYGYITQALPGYAKYQPMVDTLTGAFFKRTLAGDNSDDSNLKSLVNSQFSSLVNPFLEQGTEDSIVGKALSTSTNNGTVTCCPATDTTSSYGNGALPSYIRSPYNGIFTAAAAKYNVDPAVLVAIFYDENFGYINAVSAFQQHEFRNPPPPYGSGAPWPVSPDNAMGPFQFLPSTYAGYEIVANGHPPADPNDLTDEAFSAADYLGNLGATLPETVAKVEKAAAGYYGAPGQYSDAAGKIFSLVKDDEAGGASVGSSGGNGSSANCSGNTVSGNGFYENPERDVHPLSPARIDEGVDYVGEGPVHVLGNAVVDYVNTASGWPGGNFISYILSDGPAQGKRVYVAENCTGTTLHVGDHVTANSVVCNEQNVYPFIETGWAMDAAATGGPIDEAAAAPVYFSRPDGTATAYGYNYSQLMKSLGAPAGIFQFPYQQGGANLAGTLPAGWPQW